MLRAPRVAAAALRIALRRAMRTRSRIVKHQISNEEIS